MATINIVEIAQHWTPETQNKTQYTKSIWHCFDKSV